MSDHKKMWGYEINLGFNMWYDECATIKANDEDPIYRNFLYCKKKTWDETISFLPGQSFNTVIIDLAEGIAYESHPELAVKDSWSKTELKKELDHIRSLGMTPLPKLDFSATHDAWLQMYSRMVSTKKYQEVVKDLITEVCELFGNPELFNLGMGDEYDLAQRYYGFLVVRQEKAFWRDLYFMFDVCEHNNTRPWVSAEYYSRCPVLFKKYMPENILLTNPYCGRILGCNTSGESMATKEQNIFEEICALGYDIVPSVSANKIHQCPNDVFKYCAANLSNDHFKGIMTSPQLATVDTNNFALLHDAHRFGTAKKAYFPE